MDPTTESSNSRRSYSRCSADTWKRITTCLIILNICFLLTLIVIATVWRTEFGTPDLIDKNQLFCIDCTKVNKSNQAYEMKVDHGKAKCCSQPAYILSDLINKKVTKNHEEETSTDRFSYDYLHCHDNNKETRPATRMVGIVHPKESNSNELQWGKDEAQTFKHKGIDYIEGKLMPRHPGTYYLYSQVTVNLNDTTTAPIVHSVYRKRYRDGAMEKLLEGSISKCKLSVNTSDSTSYLGASFMFDAEDEITVKMTHPMMLKYSSMAGNYFGMHKL